MTINSRDMIVAASGADEAGRPKCEIAMFFELVEANSLNLIKRVNQITFTKPIVKVFHHAGFIQIDFIYESKTDYDLRAQWDFLESYASAENSIDGEKNVMPLFVLQIFPLCYKYKYFMMGANPIMHTLQPKDSLSDPTVIRIIFQEEDMQFLENTMSEQEKQKVVEEIEEEMKES